MKKYGYIKTCLVLGFGLAFSFLITACGGGGGSTSTPYTMINGQCYQSGNTAVPVASNLCQSMYYIGQNGQCYQTGTNQIVAQNLCTTMGNNGYYLVNGYCYGPGQQIVSSTLCSYTGMGQQGMYQACYGYYFNSTYGYVQCAGANCSGLVMMQVTSGQVYICQ